MGPPQGQPVGEPQGQPVGPPQGQPMGMPQGQPQGGGAPVTQPPPNFSPIPELSTGRKVRKGFHYAVDVVLGLAIGAVLALFLGGLILTFGTVKELTIQNNWYALMNFGQSDENWFQLSCDSYLDPAVNAPEEAIYWWCTKDGDGNNLNSANNYVIHFPAGETPPNNAFWSLTMTDTARRMVANDAGIYSVSSHSGLVPNADGSIDIYIQSTAPAGHESNWLPAPAGNFELGMRIYWPGPAALSGEYQMPPVEKVS